MKSKIETDCAIIGGGLAGCSAALELSKSGFKVDLFVKGKLEGEGNSYLLAGGLTAVPDFNIKNDNDSVSLHVKDTLEAGKNLNDNNIVKYCAEHFYPDVIQWLNEQGVDFDKIAGKYDLHREGGHSKNRIFHVKDTTGRSIMDILAKLVRNDKNIHIHEDHIAIDLITKKKLGLKSSDACAGLYIYDEKNDEVITVKCKATFLATGGIGKVFLYTSNSDVATADGFAMCYRAGLPLANMEFVQFHPTVFYDPNAQKEGERRFLLTEALRGAGAFLKTSKESKEDFVIKYDKSGSKATRDIVSRAEDSEMRRLGLTNLWLDCTRMDHERLKNDFKNSYDFCLSKGYDLTKDPVPVVYAEHYSNGGVLVGKDSETNLKNCYVIGETSYTGLHGATRLASNSGPECILFARLAAQHFSKLKNYDEIDVPLWKIGNATKSKDKIAISYYWDTIRRTMNSLCGMVRNEQRLSAALTIIQAIQKSINEYYWSYQVTKEFLEVRNIADCAEIIIKSALYRKESRACHFREDFPESLKEFEKITLIAKDLGEFIK